jgi:NADH dehydrogenase
MQSGTANSRDWILEFGSESRREVDPLMGWTSNADTQAQVRLRFDSKQAALAYAADKGIDAIVQEPHKRKPNIRPGGYGENFATKRRGVWTH